MYVPKLLVCLPAIAAISYYTESGSQISENVLKKIKSIFDSTSEELHSGISDKALETVSALETYIEYKNRLNELNELIKRKEALDDRNRALDNQIRALELILGISLVLRMKDFFR